MKLKINAVCSASSETTARYIEQSRKYPEPKGLSGHLAVVGGSPSVADHIKELQSWPGDIWAINGACMWCLDNGIESSLFSCDPGSDLVDLTHGVKRAYLAEHCAPEAFEAVPEVYRLTGSMPGPTSAVGSTVIARKYGYETVTFFGVESSYGIQSHIYADDVPNDLVRVSCGGQSFLTKLEFILQAEQLSNVIRRFPDVYSERCGGFLRALIEHGDYDVTHISPTLAGAA